MIVIKLCWMLLELALTALFLTTGTGAALALAVVIAVIPLVVWVIDLRVRNRLRFRMELPVNLRKGETAEAALVVENPTFFPVLRMRCTLEVENRLNGAARQLEVMSCSLPKRVTRIPLQLGDPFCGRLTVRLRSVKIYDCFGLIPVSCRTELKRSVTVQPDTFEQQIRLMTHSGSPDDSEIYSEFRPGSDLTETFQIREYVEGDSMRQIHWKLSGKMDRLIVRDPSLPVVRSILIFWERTGDSGDVRRVDAQAEVVLTICKTLLDQSMQFTVGWNDTEEQRCVLHSIHDLDDLVGLTPRLLMARGQAAGLAGAELLIQTLGEQEYSYVVYVGEDCAGAQLLADAGRVTVLCCGGDNGIRFDPGQYSAQLAQLDI